MNSATEGLLRSGIGIAMVRGAGLILGLAVTVVLSRALGPEGFGVYAYAVVLLALAAVPVSNGWSTLMLRTTAAAAHDLRWGQVKALARAGLMLAGIVVIALGGLAWSASRWLQDIEVLALSSVGLICLMCALFFDQLSAMRLALLRGLDRQIWGQVPEMLVRPAVILAVFLALIAWLDVEPTMQHALLALAVASIAGYLLGALLLKHFKPHALLGAPVENLPSGTASSASVLVAETGLVVLNAYVDILLLGLLTDADQVGLYRVAMQVAVLGGFVYTALNMVANQRFALFYAQGDLRSMASSATFFARVAAMGAAPLLVLSFFGGAWFLGTVFGADFMAALMPMTILLGVQVVSASFGMPRSLLIMSGREQVVAKLTTLAVLCNGLLCFLLIPKLGAVGASLASLTAMTGWNFGMWMYVRKSLRIDSSLLGLKYLASQSNWSEGRQRNG